MRLHRIGNPWGWMRGCGRIREGTPAPVENMCWIEAYARVAGQASALLQSRLVYVADREGDMLALMRHAQALGHPADWLLRAKCARTFMLVASRWPGTCVVAREQ